MVNSGLYDHLNTDMRNAMRAVFAYARMNPPTEGHRRVVERLREEAKATGSTARLYLSKTHDRKRNPLNPEQKLAYVQKLFPGVEVRLSPSIFAAANELADEGYDEATVIVGEDRLESFSKTLPAYVGTDSLGLKQVEVRAVTRNEEDVSATRARAAAIEGDWQAFRSMTPTDDEALVTELYEAVRNGMGV